MDWLRWHHGTTVDPKWRVIAADSGQPLCAVIAVWAVMLECASQGDERGVLTGWNDRVVGVSLGLKSQQVEAIRSAMEGLVIEGMRLTGWDRRQPKREREDDNSTERTRKYREQRKAATETPPEPDGPTDGVTPSDASEHQGTPRGDKRREDEIKEGKTRERATPPVDGSVVWFDGQALSVNRRAFENWQQMYPGYSDMWDELSRIDGKLAARGMTPGAESYEKAEAWLAAGHKRLKERPPDTPAKLRAIA